MLETREKAYDSGTIKSTEEILYNKYSIQDKTSFYELYCAYVHELQYNSNV